MASDNVLRLLIVDRSLEDAEQFVSILRNGGLAARPQRAESVEQVEGALLDQRLDVVVCALQANGLSLADVSEAVGRSGRDVPIIACVDQPDLKAILDAIKYGAHAVTFRGMPEQIQQVVRRELDNVAARRSLRRVESSLRESEKRCHALMDSSQDAITYVHDGMHVYANRNYLHTFSCENLETLQGTPILDLVAPEDQDKLKDTLRKLQEGEKTTRELEVRVRREDGRAIPLRMEFSSASIEDEPCTQIVIRSSAGNDEVAAELSTLRRQDLLTGLYNRQYFLDELDRSFAAGAQGTGTAALAYLELDNVKQLIDDIGHSGVDIVLRDLATLIQDHLGQNEVGARFGDYTFVILSEECPLREAEEKAERVRQAIEAHIVEVGQQTAAATVSIGISVLGEDAKDAQEILAYATHACAKAQERGGNQLHVHNPVADERSDSEESQRWYNATRQALKDNRFHLVYQPLVSLHGDGGEYYEVLLRMHTAGGDEIMPAYFIPIAEQYGLIKDVDRWVIARAVEVIRQRREDGHDTRLFIKISAPTIGDSELLPWLSKQLTAARLAGDCIVFEFRESKAITHLKTARQFIKGVKQLRCGFAIEQFGSGLNSFQLLKHLPADYLKIDRQFMQDLPDSEEHQEKIRAITEEAHSMGKPVIAEFVEDAASMSILWQIGVNYVQGHFLQEPEATLAYDFGS